MKDLYILALTLTMSSVAVVAVANAQPDFAGLDKDKDGYISVQEAQTWPYLAKVFSDVDANKDSRLDEAEYALIVPSTDSES